MVKKEKRILKHIICFTLSVFITVLMIGCDPQEVKDPLGVKQQQNTEDASSSERTSNEEESTNTTGNGDTDESTDSYDNDGWTGIY